jgi:high-affinity iron transporter
MLPSFLLSLREGLEAALILGIVFGVLKKIRSEKLKSVVWAGAASAGVVSLGIALALQAVGASFEGAAEEIFEGFAMLLAAGVLTWMIFWMQRQSKSLKTELAADVRRAIQQPGSKALFSLAFVAILREGIELSLFLTAAAATSSSQQALIGGLTGLVAAAVLGWALFASTVQLDLKRFFQITSLLLIVFAAGLVAHGVHEFNEVGWIPGIIEHVWNLNPVLDENSPLGLMLKALFGYNSNPSLTEIGAYVLYFGLVFSGLRMRRNADLPVPTEA